MNPQNLFRRAALDGQQDAKLGTIVLIRPLSQQLLVIGAALTALALIAFIIGASYTRRTTVPGQLVPDAGVLRVHAQQPGILLHKRVREGEKVRRGQILFELSGERYGNTTGNTQASISHQVALREASLRAELDKTRKLQENEREALLLRDDGLVRELAQVEAQLEGQAARLALTEAALARAQELLSQQFISREQLQTRQAEVLDQRYRHQALERDLISLQRERTTVQRDLASLPLRSENQAAQIERMISLAGQELTESEAKRTMLVTAPDDGTVSAILAEPGQAVDPARPLLALIPDGSRIHAELYVPSRAIGFIHQGSPVLLRYHAYPFQKFGHGRGRVSSFSRIALAPSELNATPGLASASEPLYRITVELTNQSVIAYGKSEALQVGMQVDADIMHERRRLYEWVLEPLFSLTGKI